MMATPSSLLIIIISSISNITIVVDMTLPVTIRTTTPLSPHKDIIPGHNRCRFRRPLPVVLPPLNDGLGHISQVDWDSRGETLHDDFAVDGGVDGGRNGGADGVVGREEGWDDGDEEVVGVGGERCWKAF